MVAYFKTGHSRQGAALGLMAQVVTGSTQHVNASELRALSSWILQAPAPAAQVAMAQAAAPDVMKSRAVMALGERLYTEHCAACHGEHGRGVAGIYPALVGNPRAARDPSTNLIRIIQEGRFGPATEGHPRPFVMPPFGHALQPHEVAAVATFVRRQWNGAGLSEVTPLQVIKQR
ncbi:MAG: c-type cytochrome [Betaproteobacteria bacterium]